MPTRGWIRIGAGLLLTVMVSWGIAGAQDGGDTDHLLVLLSVDAERPVLFQALEPDADPVTANFAPRLEVPLERKPEQPVIYTALENTGWSAGAVGLIADVFDPEADYVALELWERMGKRVLRDDGRGLMFPLVYVEALDGDETPGFRLDVVIDQGRVFRIYRVLDGEADNGGLPIRGQIIRLDGIQARTERTSVQIDPTPVLGDLLLDTHIIALPRQILTPTPVIN